MSLVTIIMPAYNAAEYLPRSIESVLNQTYSDFEFIIIDDASTDKSWSVIKSYAKKDKRITAVKNRINLGVSITSNIAISMAHGQFIAKMDADDISFGDRIEKQVSYLTANPNVVAVAGQCVLINSQDQVIGYKKFPTDFKKLNDMIFWAVPMQQPAMMINVKKLPRNFTWYDASKSSAEDVDLMFKLMLYGQIANLPDNLLFYRHLDSSLSHKDPKGTFRLTLKSRYDGLNLGFAPSFKAIILNICQIIAISLVPGNLINEIWYRVRGIKSSDSSITVTTFAESQV